MFTSPISNLTEIQSYEDWVTQATVKEGRSPHIVVFFVSPKCGACLRYKKSLETLVTSFSKRKEGEQVDFLLFDISLIQNNPNLKKVVEQFEFSSIPTVLLLERQQPTPKVITQLNEHRSHRNLESNIQKLFYPEKNVEEMIGIAGVYELKKWLAKIKEVPAQISDKEKARRKNLTDLIYHLNMNTGYVDEYVMVSQLPNLIKSKQYLQKLAFEVAKISNDSEWATWIEKQLYNKKINKDDLTKLPPNERIKDFLIKKLYHYYVRTTLA